MVKKYSIAFLDADALRLSGNLWLTTCRNINPTDHTYACKWIGPNFSADQEEACLCSLFIKWTKLNHNVFMNKVMDIIFDFKWI